MPDERIRTAELIGATCLATDLAMGFPFEHGLHATLMAMRLADLLDVDATTASETYHASLLMYVGCTTDAELSTRIFGGSMTANVTPVQFGSTRETFAGVVGALPDPPSPPLLRMAQIAGRLPKAARYRGVHFAAMCEVATMLAERLGAPAPLPGMFTYLTERWDGKGVLRRALGEEIPQPIRIVHVARDAAYQQVIGGDEHATETIHARAGHAFDPTIADMFGRHAREILSVTDEPGSAWEAMLAAEPKPWLSLGPEETDLALAAIGDFADLVAPSFTGHSSGVAHLAEAAAILRGFDPAEVSLVRRAGHVHDIGRVAVHPRIWQTRQPLTADGWEQVRLHAYHVERVFARAPSLAPLGAVACAHHERLNGTGYHRGVTASSLPPSARLLACADTFHAMIEPRPHRAALALEDAASLLAQEASSGRLDPSMVSAVLEASGQPRPAVGRPAGLTEREAEVIGLLAQGLQTKHVARRLGISVKTADRHVQNAYRKAGISSRAAATLFAMEHGLVSWGEFPIEGRSARS